MRLLTAVLGLLVVACQPSRGDEAQAQARSDDRANTTTFTRGSGGTIVTTLSRNIKVNDKSTLEREWITAHDSLSPVDLVGTVGITTVYKPGTGYSSGEYVYTSRIGLDIKEPISALQLRFVLFDIWGQFTKTLSATEVEDLPPGTARTLTPEWRVYSENEVSEHYASLAYVARVRTKAGRVFEANYIPIVEEARKLSSQFEPAWLDPKVRPVADSVPRRP